MDLPEFAERMLGRKLPRQQREVLERFEKNPHGFEFIVPIRPPIDGTKMWLTYEVTVKPPPSDDTVLECFAESDTVLEG